MVPVKVKVVHETGAVVVVETQSVDKLLEVLRDEAGFGRGSLLKEGNVRLAADASLPQPSPSDGMVTLKFKPAAGGAGAGGGTAATDAQSRQAPPQRSAAGLPEEPPAGPPDVSWLDTAGKAEQQEDGNWIIHRPDGSRLPYVDPDGEVRLLRDWLPSQQRQKRYVSDAFKQQAVSADPKLRPAVPTIINGLTKTGKSYTQRYLLLALVADSLQTGELKGPAPVLLQLDGALLEMRSGAKARLLSLLDMLLWWAVAHNVPVDRLAWQIAMEGRRQQTVGFLSSAIRAFFHGLQAPVLVVFDEFQNLLLPEAVRDVAEVDYASHIRDAIVKPLLVYGPRNVAWNITGSCMVMVWMQIAQMPPNGFSLFLGNRTIQLPATYPADSMRVVWDHLVNQDPDLPPELFQFAEPTPAMLEMMARDWLAEGRAPDIAAFAGEFARRKLRDEAKQGWRAALEAMPVALRKAVYDLSSVVCGCDTAILQSDSGLHKFLQANLKTNANGRYYLKSATQRQLIQLILDDEGQIISAVGTRHIGSLLQLEARELFRQLGEAVAGFGMLKPAKYTAELAPAAFLEAFEGLASQLDARVSHTLWPLEAWFVMAQSSPYCTASAAEFKSLMGKSVLTQSMLLAWYFRFVRHTVAHNKPWDQHTQPIMVLNDISLFSGFAAALGIGVEELVQCMEDMLALLRPSMVSGSMEASMPGGDSATRGSTLSAATSSRPCTGLSSPAVGSSAATLLRHNRRPGGAGMDGVRLVVGRRGCGAPGAHALRHTGAAHRPVLTRLAAPQALKSASGALRQAGCRMS